MRKRAHFLRGATYFLKGNLLNTFNDFVDSNKYDPDLKFISPQNYVASQIADIYKGSKKEDKAKAFGLYLKLLHSIMRIQIKQFYKPEKGRKIAHYTFLSTLKDLANEERFRFYLDAYDSFRFDEVILGPETHGVREWTQLLKKRDIKTKKSEIKYGKQPF